MSQLSKQTVNIAASGSATVEFALRRAVNFSVLLDAVGAGTVVLQTPSPNGSAPIEVLASAVFAAGGSIRTVTDTPLTAVVVVLTDTSTVPNRVTVQVIEGD